MSERRVRGSSMIEVMVIVFVVVVGMCLLLPMLARPNRTAINQVKDATQLSQIHKSFVVFSRQFDGRYPTPSVIARIDPSAAPDRSLDTTANIYSALIAQNYFTPQLIISPVEASDKVRAKHEYDLDAYDPAGGVFWDSAFKADLAKESNASYAHLVLFGERFENQWRDTLNSEFAIFGNRGPKDGVDDPKSITYRFHGGSEQWVGNIVYNDGHVNTENSFTVAGITFRRGELDVPDNFFAIDDGVGGRDTVLSFTKILNEDGPEVQHD